MLFVVSFVAVLAFTFFSMAEAVGAACVFSDRNTLALTIAALVIAVDPIAAGLKKRRAKKRREMKHRTRKRKTVRELFQELGPNYTRRAYRMEERAFWKLLLLLSHTINVSTDEPKPGSSKTNSNGAKNGLIRPSIRLSAAIRYFAGGRPDDIALSHGISHSEVFRSVWKVVDAIHKCKELDIKFPSSYEAQLEIARGFAFKSKPRFSCCVGAIDGILIWCEKPNQPSCDEARCGPKKFFCGRKKKFGVAMQAICDHEGRFTDVSIKHPGSTSDFLCFTTSSIFDKLEKDPAFLSPGLCFFGNNAYVNASYMATPYKAVRSGVKDDYNFYHSQVRWTMFSIAWLGFLSSSWAH